MTTKTTQTGPSPEDVKAATDQLQAELESPEFAKALADVEATADAIAKTEHPGNGVDTRTPRKIAASEVKVGDRIARAKTHPFLEVLEVRPGTTAMVITFANVNGRQDRIKPRKTSQLWILRDGDEVKPVKKATAKKPAAKKATSKKATTPDTGERVTFKDAAEKVLRDGNGPLKVAVIAELAIPLVRPVPEGKTPKATLGAHLITDANKGGRFVKTAPGTFDVRELNPRGATKRPAKRAAKKAAR